MRPLATRSASSAGQRATEALVSAEFRHKPQRRLRRSELRLAAVVSLIVFQAYKSCANEQFVYMSTCTELRR
jgi:hypothetical protein